ncbi:497df385-445e-4097-bfd8-b7a1fd65287b [Sclerotinia trifoliorum]|uniref:497df385-445e-4097-bfd8-b7a1fd65287b n=1 Tax=Sclerotinia trifoliorum TaxID=28548 RepID=A0A8H2ZPD7_9HELO|nr:497df385-445e-4097-bfd8-b7a1fd65287b [Sclerotinia trifoliorum]
MASLEILMTEQPSGTRSQFTALEKDAPQGLRETSGRSAHNHLQYLSGWRLSLLTLGLCLSLMLSSLDITIVSTALVTISDDLHAFDQSSWIVNSYLTTYFSALIIWAKMSDLVGRKVMLVAAIVIFLAFSGGCGGAATSTQIIAFRALQGIGGAGIFSMVPIIVAEMVVPEQYGKFNGIVSLALAISFLLGPVLGGAIPQHTTWRWIFLINLPIGVVGLILVLLAMPAGFPDNRPSKAILFSPKKSNLRGEIDYVGFLLLPTACVFLIVAFEEAGVAFAWDSALVITFLVLAFVLLCLFFAWQRLLFLRQSARQPVIPWVFLKNRVLMGIYIYAVLSGVPFVTLVIEIPQRIQSISNTSTLIAGVRVLPYTMSIAVGSAITGGLTAKGRIPPLYVLIAATSLQTLGTGLLYSIPVAPHIPASFYGYQVLAGMGVGLGLTTLLNIAPFIVEKQLLAVALGGVTQMRILGGAIGVAIATSLLNNTVVSTLADILPAETVSHLLQNLSSMSSLSSHDQAVVQSAFAHGYHKQLAMILGFCAAEVFAIGLMWERTPRRLL